ncbi:MAG: putative capsid protein [Hattula totivirus 1]|nr:MAG: putative capsid protein [Hattula totivirus 1]
MSVGASRSHAEPPPASSGAAALMAKMFSEPLKDPTPSGAHFLPCNTEEVVGEREGKGSQYSPVMWADPLIPVNLSLGSTHSAINKFPAVGCSVNNRYDGIEPALTAIGAGFKAIVDTEAAPTILRSMMPVKGMKDTSALICLMETSRRTGFQAMTDEAPLIRLGLLMHCLAPPEWMAYSTSCVQNLCANGYADVTKASRKWTKAPTNTTQTEIGVEAGSSSLYWRTLGQYARLISGSAQTSDLIVGNGNTAVDTSSVKFLPVKMSWRGQSWLGPYILAHTTTKWWNHAVTVNIPVLLHDQKDATKKAELKCMPKAATVYIPGSYKHICLVIVDVVETSFPAAEHFYIGNSYRATYAGNHDFAKIGHKLLGRNTDAPATPATMTDCMAAWRVMCKGLLSHVSPAAIEIRLAVLATSRFAGFSVWTDEVKPKVSGEQDFECLRSGLDLGDTPMPKTLLEWMAVLKNAMGAAADPEIEGNEAAQLEQKVVLIASLIDAKWGEAKDGVTEKDHVAGVTCMDPKTDLTIGDHSVPDWFSAYNTTATMPDRVKLYTWWRVDPLHSTSQALITCTDGTAPALEKFSSGEIQYELTEATDLIRVLSYADMYQDNSACSGAIVEPIDILNRSLGFGALLLGITEYWRASMGLTLLDFNKVSSSWKLVDPASWKLMQLATNDFFVTSPSTTNTAWSDSEFGLMELIKTQLGVTDAKWADHWYGGVVPWWFVQAVLVKFGGEIKLRTNTCTSVRLSVDEDWLDEEGFHLKSGISAPTDISVLTSTLRYEKRVQRKAGSYFTILTPTKDGHTMKVHWTSWYYNYVNDLSKSGIRRRTRVEKPDFDGVVELNCMSFPDSRRFKGYANQEGFVDRNNRYLLPLDHTVFGGLTWPDPFMDWLKQGLIAIEPHLLNLDVVGAVGAALGHVNKTIIDWLNDKIHGDQSFRS